MEERVLEVPPSDHSERHPTLFQRWKSQIGGVWSAPVVIFFAIGCAFSIAPIMNAILEQRNKDYSHWHLIGRLVLAGKPLYEDVRNGEPEYMYPPTAAVLFYGPLSNLNQVSFVAVLCLLNAASWVFSVWAATVLITRKWEGLRSLIYFAPGLAVAPYIWDIQLLGQTNLLLLALTLGSFVSLRNQHSVMAGSLFGLAVAMKAFPLPAIAYFIVRRKWIAVVCSIFSVFAFVWFFPGAVRGFNRNTMEIGQWAKLMIVDQSGETMAGRSSIGFTRRNQSIVSCSHRLLRHVDAGDNPSKPLYINFMEVTPRTAQLIGYGICLMLGLVLLLACRLRFAPSWECEGVEVAMVCTLVPLCSPLAWTYFFCWLLPAWTAVAFWFDNPMLSARTRRVVVGAVVVAATLLISAVSEQFDPTLQAYGVTAWGSVVLFLTLAYIRFNLPNTPLVESI